MVKLIANRGSSVHMLQSRVHRCVLKRKRKFRKWVASLTEEVNNPELRVRRLSEVTIQRYESNRFSLSYYPQLNPNWQPTSTKGKNAAPSKSDDSVLSTVLDVKVRDDSSARDSASVVTSAIKSIAKSNRHDELRLRGEQKRKLLAALAPKPLAVTAPVDNSSMSKIKADTSETKMKKVKSPVEQVLNMKKRKNQRKVNGSLFEDADDIKTSLDPSKPAIEVKHSEKKRKKMRDRERAKREKLRLKKEAKMETKRPAPKPTSSWERPTESIRELGMKLAQKLSKESSDLRSAYDSIKKRSDLQ